MANNIDTTLLAKLDSMRDKRDEAARYAEQLIDEAKLHDIESIRLRSQSVLVVNEINQGIPVPQAS